MTPMLREREGRDALRRRFEAAGLTIVEDYLIEDLPRAVALDGYDPVRRVGYELCTEAAGDREMITAAVIHELERRMKAGRMYVLLVDESDVAGEDELLASADGFLAELKALGVLP